MQACVDVAGAALARERQEPGVAGAAALRTRAVAGRERRGLVEEEELGVAPRPEQLARAALELEHARDPPLHLPLPPDRAGGVVQAAAIAVDEPAGGIRDQLAERCDPVPPRHRATLESRG